jgi:uncharacterized glyoxalase superfamily protein PhnB
VAVDGTLAAAAAPVMQDTSYRPEGVTTITAYLTVKGGAQAIDFYKRAFDAEELYRLEGDGGRIDHATLRIGDSTLYLCDENEHAQSPTTLGGTPITFHMYVPDCDAIWRRAVDAGATQISPVADQDWGDRYGQVEDPFGYRWGIATQKEAAPQ